MTSETAPVAAEGAKRRSLTPIIAGVVLLVAVAVVIALVLSAGAVADPMAGT